MLVYEDDCVDELKNASPIIAIKGREVKQRLYFEYGDHLCIVVYCFLFFASPSLVFRQGPHFRMMFFFPFAFHLCFLSLILMRTDLGDEPSTRWKCTDPTLRGQDTTRAPQPTGH